MPERLAPSPEVGIHQILLIDDDADDHVLVRDLIDDAFGDRAVLHWEGSYAGGLDALMGGAYDICLLDYRLGARTGLDLLREAHRRGVSTPTILLTGQSAREIDLAATEAGAADYLVKGEITASLIERTIRYTLRHARAQADLRESEARYRSLFDHNPHAVYGFDLEGRFIAANRATEVMTGYPSAQLMTMSFQELIEPDDLPIAEDVFGQARDERKATEYELRIRHREGRELHIQGVSVPQVTDGVVQAVYGTAQDITEQKRVRSELAQREREFEALAENAPDIIARFDRAFRHVYVNPVISRVTGVARQEFIGKTHAELGMPSDLVRRWREAIDRAFRSAEQHTVEFEFQGPERTFAFHAHFNPEFGPDGSVETVLCISRDITELRETQEMLERRERRFRTLAERSTEVLSLIDRDGRMFYKSPSIRAILGYDPEELTGERAFTLVHPEDRAAAEDALRRVVESGATGAVEYRHRHKDGSWRVMSAVGENLLDDPDVNAIVVHSRDVTQAKELETQLRQSQKLEAVGQLAGGIAHDFNNVLTAIQGNAQMVLMDLDGSDLRPDIEEIVHSSRRAADLTRQLLAFSRQQVLHPRIIDLHAIISGMQGMLDRLIGEDVEMEVSAPAQLGPVRADPSQIEQVVMNLAVNARDAMPGGGTLRISLDDVELDEHAGANLPYEVRPGSYVLLAVKDEGVGMDAETRARLFEPFFTTKPEGKGTGLGLPTVYGIVKQSDGYIWVDSDVGEGTTVRVYLPHAGDGARPEALERGGARLDGDLGGDETILVCEDQDPVRKLARRALERYGYRVLEAVSGRDALAIAEEYDGPIPLVLTDVIMPKMGGTELATRLREVRPESKVLYMSGYARREIAERGGFPESGEAEALESITEFIQKPFEPKALVAAVRTALDAANAE